MESPGPLKKTVTPLLDAAESAKLSSAQPQINAAAAIPASCKIDEALDALNEINMEDL